MNTFRIDYKTGNLTIVVAQFFGKSNKRNIKKFLRFATYACTLEQKEELIKSINSEIEGVKDGLQKLIQIESSWISEASKLLDRTAEMPMTAAKKELIQMCKRMEMSLDLIKEAWKL